MGPKNSAQRLTNLASNRDLDTDLRRRGSRTLHLPCLPSIEINSDDYTTSYMGLDKGRNVILAAAAVKSNLVQSVNCSQWMPEQHAKYHVIRNNVNDANSHKSLSQFRVGDMTLEDVGYWRGHFSLLDAVLHMASADQQKN